MCEPIRIQDAKWAARVEAARKLLRMNVLTHEQIAQAEDLPLKKVQELAEEITAEKQSQEDKQQEAAKAEVGKPFPYEAELTAKTARLVELDLQLNLNGGRAQPQPEQTVAKNDRPSILERLKQPLPQKSSDIPKTHILEASI